MVLILFLCQQQATVAIDYHIAAMLPLTGWDSPAPSIANQWSELLQFSASQITTSWANADRLLLTVYDTQSSRFRTLQIANSIATNASMLAVVTVGLPDTLVEEISLVLKLAEVWPRTTNDHDLPHPAGAADSHFSGSHPHPPKTTIPISQC